jgi:anti-sigma28 factor (negative regulator of flagellin synthesis)
MKIYDSGQQPNGVTSGSTQQTHRAEGSGRGTSASSRRAGRTDEVQLSALGSYLAGEAASPDREAKVSSLAAVYRSGHYSVSAEAVSSRIIDDATHVR